MLGRRLTVSRTPALSNSLKFNQPWEGAYLRTNLKALLLMCKHFSTLSGPGKTLYGGDCRYDHPCAKYDGKSYYWCYTAYGWDKCSPTFDRNEIRVEPVNFDRNFEISTDENISSLHGQLQRAGERWPGYPSLYRILGNKNYGRMDEGNGLWKHKNRISTLSKLMQESSGWALILVWLKVWAIERFLIYSE